MSRTIPGVILGAALVTGAVLSASASRATANEPDEQLVVPGRGVSSGLTADVSAKLLPTTHPPVPTGLSSMWLAPAQGARLSPALANLVRGVKLLEEAAGE